MRGRLLSVIVPVFRNEATLAELHRRIAAALEREAIAREIIFVDDGSDDRSAEAIRGIMSRDPGVRLLSLPKNGGQQQAVLAGMRAARGELVATLDADLQDPPEALPSLVARMDGSADAVFATRRGAYESAVRLRTSRFFKWLLGKLTSLPPGAGMFLVMTGETARAILDAPPQPFYLPSALMRVTRRVAAVPVERARRTAGTSQYTSLGRARLAIGALVGALRSHPRRPLRRHR